MSETQLPEHFLQFASTNLATAEYAQLGAFGYPSKVGHVALEAGFDAVELHPYMLTRSSVLVQKAVNEGNLIVGSLMQSPLDADRSIAQWHDRPKLNLDERVKALKAAPGKYARILGAHMLRPSAMASLNFMQDVQHAVGRPLPVVMRPGIVAFDDTFRQRHIQAASCSIMPTDAVVQRWGMPLKYDSKATEAFVEETRRRGYDFALNTYDVRRRYTGVSETVSQLTHRSREDRLALVASATTSLRLSLCPADIDRDDNYIGARRELKELLNGGAFTGGLAELVHAVQDRGRIDRVVVDAHPGALAKTLHDLGWGSLNKPNRFAVKAAYAEIGRAVRNALK